MTHEIYYTSAPEGLKRGTSGFCTVAASDNIPRALWDRLESLSAYRHHFSVDAHAGAAPAGQNPVSFAHWILSVTGKTHHVLSRVCDSGVDHTQRTNAFAHHLVLDAAEMDAASGGPAWLLSQGVMAGQWDGRVGALTASRIPTGTGPGARICSNWAQATGDAGWGGHLADLFVKAPTRPVCILFSPGQELLPLLGEAIALLPPAARWNVTFNTYFTSMPTSATCLWRCCLAGTPAAQIGVRYAANGLILDLTDRNRLPALPPGPMVTAARTGQSAAPPARTTPPAPPVPAGPAKRPTRSAPTPAGKGAGKRPQVDPDDDEEEQLEKERAAIFEFTPADEAQIAGGVSHDPYELADLAAAEAQLPARPAARARTSAPAGIMRRANDALAEAEHEADRAAARRRKQVVYLFAGALGALAIGTALVFLNGKKNSPPPEIPETTRPRIASPAPPPPTPEIVPTAPVAVGPAIPIDTAPAPIIAQTQTVQSAPAPQPARIFPETLTLAATIDRPNIAGVGDRVQSFPLPAADLDHPAAITSAHLHLPQGKPDPAIQTPPGDNSYTSPILGTFTATAEMHAARPGVSLAWKSTGAPGAAAEIAFIAFDHTRPGLDLQWHSSQLLKNPDLFSSIYWLLQNSAVELAATPPPPHEKNQRIVFKPFDLPALSLNDAATNIPWPVDLPRETSVIPPKAAALPPGWEATWYSDWETKDPVLRSAANASQVLKFKKTGSGTGGGAGVDAWFLLIFRPGLSKVESTLAKRRAEDQADLARYQSELNSVKTEVDEARARATPLGVHFDTDPSGMAMLAKQSAAQQIVDAYQAALAAYHELTTFDVAFDQPDGLHLTTLHFKSTDPP